MMSPAWRISAGGSRAPKHSRRAWNGWKPDERVDVQPSEPLGRHAAATSSISIPPAVVSIRSGRFAPRSNVIEK